ncbi:MAG TPA: ABC transporter permease, partial [Chitinophagaceae bacterium]|nr:ABC transporter permease [Chitinophagaceae bacterium]
MLRNYFKIAFRNLLKQKAFSAINLFGLTVGLVSVLLIALYLFDELTSDRFHKNAEDIYRIVETKTSPEGKETKVVSVAANIATKLKNDYPEVANATRFSMFGRVNVANTENRAVFYESYYMADSSFFSVFDFPQVAGDLKAALTEPYSVVLTDETAKKIFGNTAAVGRTLNTEGDSTPYKITGVISIPKNSHLQFNLLFSESSLYSLPQFAQTFTADWSSNNFVTYVQLKNKTAVQTAGAINQFVKANREDNGTTKSSFVLQPLKDIHFGSAGLEGSTETSGNITHVYVFGIVAFFVLLIACINYMNLTTARFAGRSKEIAVRKVAGASQKNLIKQFLTEASLLTLVALVLALGIVKLALPRFNTFTEKNLHLGFGTDYRIWLMVLLTAVFVGIAAGLYPAFYQSRLKPYALLKNKVAAGKGNLSVRRMLVVFQFSLSIIMIVATVVVYQQMKYVDSTDMGFNKQQ